MGAAEDAESFSAKGYRQQAVARPLQITWDRVSMARSVYRRSTGGAPRGGQKRATSSCRCGGVQPAVLAAVERRGLMAQSIPWPADRVVCAVLALRRPILTSRHAVP